ncbi:hypothetical protein [Streptomyces misionensis]|uniref:hypothetical protein n=1 Tax=Streptomyces misionensis TaxID=67331 RepID=UPI0033A30753
MGGTGLHRASLLGLHLHPRRPTTHRTAALNRAQNILRAEQELHLNIELTINHFTVILATANHFVSDAVAGAATLAVGFLVQQLLTGRPACPGVCGIFSGHRLKA